MNSKSFLSVNINFDRKPYYKDLLTNKTFTLKEPIQNAFPKQSASKLFLLQHGDMHVSPIQIIPPAAR